MAFAAPSGPRGSRALAAYALTLVVLSPLQALAQPSLPPMELPASGPGTKAPADSAPPAQAPAAAPVPVPAAETPPAPASPAIPAPPGAIPAPPGGASAGAPRAPIPPPPQSSLPPPPPAPIGGAAGSSGQPPAAYPGPAPVPGTWQPTYQYPSAPAYGGQYVDPYGVNYYTPAPPRKKRERWTKYKNGLYVDPLALLVGALEIEYERALHDRVSVFVGPQVILGFGAYSGVSGAGGRVGPRIFFFGRAPEGLWLAPEGNFLWLTDGDGKVASIGVGGMLGYTAVWHRFALSPGIGVTYARFSGDLGDEDRNQVFPTIRISMGAAMGE